MLEEREGENKNENLKSLKSWIYPDLQWNLLLRESRLSRHWPRPKLWQKTAQNITQAFTQRVDVVWVFECGSQLLEGMESVVSLHWQKQSEQRRGWPLSAVPCLWILGPKRKKHNHTASFQKNSKLKSEGWKPSRKRLQASWCIIHYHVLKDYGAWRG